MTAVSRRLVPTTQLLDEDDGLYEVINGHIIRMSRGPIGVTQDRDGDAITGMFWGMVVMIFLAIVFFGGWLCGRWFEGGL